MTGYKLNLGTLIQSGQRACVSEFLERHFRKSTLHVT